MHIQCQAIKKVPKRENTLNPAMIPSGRQKTASQQVSPEEASPWLSPSNSSSAYGAKKGEAHTKAHFWSLNLTFILFFSSFPSLPELLNVLSFPLNSNYILYWLQQKFSFPYPIVKAWFILWEISQTVLHEALLLVKWGLSAASNENNGAYSYLSTLSQISKFIKSRACVLIHLCFLNLSAQIYKYLQESYYMHSVTLSI